jgi:membrane-associated phospholipid phosphatase
VPELLRRRIRQVAALVRADVRPPSRIACLLPASARRTASIVLVCSALITAVGGYACARGAYGDPIDGPVDSWMVTHLGSHGHVLQLAADLGQPLQVAVVTIVLILACLAGRQLNGAVLAAISVPVAGLLTEDVLKPLVNESYAAYPSGRTTGAFALIAIISVLLAQPSRWMPHRDRRIAVVAAAVLIGCAVCVATVGLGDHHFTDTVGGAAVGTGVVLTATFLLDLPVVRSLLALAYPGLRRAAVRAQEAEGPARPTAPAKIGRPASGEGGSPD